MSRRVITPEIFEDEWFGELSDREALIWIGLFGVMADDQGRFTANAAVIRSRLFVYRDVPVADVAAALDAFSGAGKLHRCDAGDRPAYQVATWWKHQRPKFAAESAYPPPDGWTDRVKTRTNGEFVTSGWDTTGGFDARTNGSHERIARTARANGSCGGLVLAHEPVPVPEPVPINPEDLYAGGPVDNYAAPAPDEDLGGSDDPLSDQELPSFPTILCGPIRRAGGDPSDVLEEGSDLNITARRYLATVSELVDTLLGHLSAAKLESARERALRAAFADAERTKPANLAAYLTTSRKRATHLGDLIGDDLVSELLAITKRKGTTNA